MKIEFQIPTAPFTAKVRMLLGAVIALAALVVIASAWTLPFLFESPTLYYKFGLDKTLLRGGKLMGLTATILLLFQLLMVSRFKFLDKIFSLNRLYTVHRYNGIAILTLALLHGVSILAAGNFTFFPLEIRYWPEFLGISTAVVMLGIVISANWRQSLRMPYEFWRRTHQVVAPLSITAVCVHLLFVSETFESGLPRWLAMGFASLNMLLIGRLWFRRLFHRPRLHEVVSITPAGQNAVAVTLAARNSPTLAYLPGQFAFIRPLSARLPREEHPFTIASSPIQSKLLQFVIGAKGDWTNQVDRLVVGDPVRVDGPYGVFSHIALADKGPVIMIAGGIGVTPMLSMLRYMADTGDTRSLLLIWSLRSKADMIFADEFESLQQRLANLRVELIFTRNDGPDKTMCRLDPTGLEHILEGWPRNASLFVCGPPAMMDTITNALKSIGFQASRIYTERFQF